MQDIAARMRKEFEARFTEGGDVFAVCAPGRVNLIGEHTDYNDGFVLPVALDHAVYILGRAVSETASRLYSINFNEMFEFDLAKGFKPDGNVGWGRYMEGTARVLAEKSGAKLSGMEAVVWGDVPLGSGLSSSAALEVATGFFMLEAAGAQIFLPQLARWCQEAENRYVGVQCGIMDQFASCLGAEGRAIFLDCRSLDYELVPLNLDGYVLMVLNSNVPRGLAGSAYNDRRRACEEGVAIIKNEKPDVRALRDVSSAEFEEYAALMPADTAAKCRHIVTENERVLKSVECLRTGDLESFGRLMVESHRSLRYDYQVTCPELDLLHDACIGLPGVIGERMTGAGFGGCSVAVVESVAAPDVQSRLEEIYKRETGLKLEVYRTAARAGARRIGIC